MESLEIESTEAESLNLRGLDQLATLKVVGRNVQSIDLTGLTNLTTMEVSSTIDLQELIYTTLPNLHVAEIYLWRDKDPEGYILDLSSFDLTYLKLTTNVTVRLGDQPNLQTLNARAYHYEGDARDLSGSKKLTDVHLAYADLDVLDLSDCPLLETLTTEDPERISSVDVSGCVWLEELKLSMCQVEELDIRGAVDLTSVVVSGPIFWVTEVPVSGRSNELRCGDNDNLQYMEFFCENLKSLDLGLFPNLVDADIYADELSSLSLSGNEKLVRLGIMSSKLTSLDLSKCPVLQELYVSGNAALKNLNLKGTHLLKKLMGGESPIEKLDLSDCWSIEEVFTRRDYSTSKGTLVNPTGFPSSKVTFEGWRQSGQGQTVYNELKPSSNDWNPVISNPITVKFHHENGTRTEKVSYALWAYELAGADSIGWSRIENDTQVDYKEGELIVPTGDMDLYAVYAKWCKVTYEVPTGSSVMTMIYTGFPLPYGAETCELQLGEFPDGDPADVPEISGWVHSGWKVYDLDGPDPKTPVVYGVDEVIDLHGSALIEALHDKVVSNAKVELTMPQIDGTITEARTDTTGVTVTTTWKQFWNGYPIKNMYDDAVFASGQKYRCYMELEAEDGYQFGENLVLTTPGITVEYSSFTTSSIVVYVDFEPQDPYLHLLNFIVPVAGMQTDEGPDYDIGSTYPCIRSGFRWLDASKNEFSGTFAAGSTYYTEITLDTRVGEFDEDMEVKVQKIGGKTSLIIDSCEISGKRCTLVVKCVVPRYLVEMTVALPPADSIASPDAGINYTVDSANTSYRVVSSTWKNFSDGSNYYGKIYPGEVYTAYFEFELSAAGSTGFLINGQVPAVNVITTRQANVSINMEAQMRLKVSFDSGGGTGTMDGEVLASGTRYFLPFCEFTAPEGKRFDCWSIDGSDYLMGSSVIITEDTEIRAKWEDIPQVSITASLSGDTVKATAKNLEPGGQQVVFAVQYDSNGIVRAVETSGIDFENPTCRLSGFNAESGDTFKVFLLDAKSFEPLCEPDTI